MDLAACWSEICDVDVTPLVAWLAEAEPQWPVLPSPTKPQRVFNLPGVAQRIIWEVCQVFPEPVLTASPMLSRMAPGQSHPMHVDGQRADWITRVHVPLVTNDGCWMLWEEEGERVHFQAGKAYTFDTTRRHSFGNDGDTDRVHLIFDVLRRD